MPCTPSEAISVIGETADLLQNDPLATSRFFGDLIDSFDASAPPPLVETIYLDQVVETASDIAFDIVAGNRVSTYWKMRLSLTASGASTTGSLVPVNVNENKWLGNVMTMVYTLKRAVESVGGSTGKWPGSQ